MSGVLPPSQNATDERVREFLIPVVSGVAELLFGDTSLFNNRPGFIAGPPPDTGLATAVQEVSRLNCRRWGASDKSAFSDRVNQGNAELCGPYLDDLAEGVTDGELGYPFRGGQCPGVLYQIDYSFTREDGLSFTEQGFLNGPINREVWGSPGPGDEASVDSCSTNFPARTFRRYQLRSAFDGAGLGLISGCGATLDSLAFTRADGLPDDCGDPPPIVQPPSTVEPVTPVPPGVTINLPGFGPVDVTLTLNPNGEPVVCIEGSDICVTVTPPPGSEGGGTGQGLPGPGDVGEPGATEGTGEGGEAEGEAPEGTVLTGLKIDVVEVAGGGTQYAPGVYRALGYIYMGVPGLLDQDFGGSMVRSGQFLFAEKDNLTAWKVYANFGVTLSVTPYYREVEEE